MLLIDQNLPKALAEALVSFYPGIKHVKELGMERETDTSLWNYASENDFIIVTKDSDFSNRIMIASPPPWVVHLRFGNLRRYEFHLFLERAWAQIEALLPEHKLINVYLDRMEAIRD